MISSANKRTKQIRAAASALAKARAEAAGGGGGFGGGAVGAPPDADARPPGALRRAGEGARTHNTPRDGEILILVPLFDEPPKRQVD